MIHQLILIKYLEHRFPCKCYLTYFCDGCWTSNSSIRQLWFGGDTADGALCGLFACLANGATTYTTYDLGASISY